MPTIEQIQQMLDPVFPGLMGVRLVTVEPERVVAELKVRPDLCTIGGILHGGASMAFADSSARWHGRQHAARQAHDHDRLQHQVHRAARVDTTVTRRMRGAPPRANHDGVVDVDPVRRGQALRRRTLTQLVLDA